MTLEFNLFKSFLSQLFIFNCGIVLFSKPRWFLSFSYNYWIRILKSQVYFVLRWKIIVVLPLDKLNGCETRTFLYALCRWNLPIHSSRGTLGTPRRDHDAQRYSTTNYRGRRCRHAPAPTTASDLGSSSPNCCPRRNHRCVSSAINNAPICTTTLIREEITDEIRVVKLVPRSCELSAGAESWVIFCSFSLSHSAKQNIYCCTAAGE